MNDEMRKRLEAKAADDAEAADGWELAGCEAGRVARLRRQVADLRTVLAEIDRLRAERDAIAEAAIIEGWQRIGEGEWDENDPDVVKRYFEVRIGHRCQEADTHKAALAIVRRAAGLEPEGR